MSRSRSKATTPNNALLDRIDESHEAVPAPCHESVREAAYYKWLASGCPEGDGIEFWLEAEAELVATPSISSSSTSSPGSVPA